MNLTDEQIIDRIERLAKEAGRGGVPPLAKMDLPCGDVATCSSYERKLLDRLKIVAKYQRGLMTSDPSNICICGTGVDDNILYGELFKLLD